mmetsp:Transcript_2916/g.4234  ORF Transcript_2916/g.4234 Transcript_2916/m.4234 type:complete len:1247 (+) Transcript_2916:67-3807(+)
MKQIGLISSGIQKWNKRVLYAGGNKLIFCSTLAIYVYRLDNFSLERILTGHSSPIISITQSPHDNHFIATASSDQTIKIWDINSGQLIKTVEGLTSAPLDIDWSPVDKYEILIGSRKGSLKLYNYLKKKSVAIGLKSASENDIIGCSFNPQKPNVAFVAMSDSTTLIIDTKKRTILNRFRQTSAKIADFSWDPLSDTYLLVAYQNGEMYLFDTEGKGEFFRLHTFEKVNGGISSIDWIISEPGNFVTGDLRSGNLRYWNVSQAKSIRVVRVRRSGFRQCRFVGGSEDTLMAQSFVDGTVAIYNMAQNKIEFLTTPGHTETIFDCAFANHDPNLFATCSYDGNIKIWNTKSMTCISDLFCDENVVIYSVAWHPTENKIAGCMGDGRVWIWDVEKNRAIQKLTIHNTTTKLPAYKIAWGKTCLATTGKDNMCFIFNESGKILKSFRHPAAVFGVDFNPFDNNIIATGCYDGVVRVFDISKELSAKKFKGHKDRVFNIKWHPIYPNVLMSGSNDCTIRVWNVDNSQFKELKGHKHNVRALAWNPELPNIALSGSWDGTIRIWNVNTESCIRVINDHHADVYGLSVHPDRPFIYGSTSRDTTIRFWTLEPIFKNIMVQSIIAKQLAPRISPGDIFQDHFTSHGIAGARSEEINQLVSQCKTTAEKYRLIFNFFSFPQQSETLWNLVNVVMNDESNNEKGYVHSRQLSHVLETRAREMESIRHKKYGGGIGSIKKEDQLKDAAEIYLSLGMFKEYCELLFEIGEYERAIAMAPRESLIYWQELSSRYAKLLEEKQSVDAVPFFLASNQIEELISFYEKRHELDNAGLIALRDAEGAFSNNQEVTLKSKSISYPKKITSNMRMIANKRAKSYLRLSQPILAAAAFLAIDDFSQAIRTLVKGDELFQAYALAQTLNINDSLDYIHLELAQYCVEHHIWDTAISLIHQVENRNDVLHFLCSINDSTLSHSTFTREKLFLKAGFQAPSFYSSEASNLARDPDTKRTAITYFALGGQNSNAVPLALDLFKHEFSKKTWNWSLISEINRASHWISLNYEESEKNRDLLLAYSYFCGAQSALWKGYYKIAPFLITLTRSLTKDLASDFAIRRSFLDYMLCYTYFFVDIHECLNYIQQVKSANLCTGDLFDALNRLESRAEKEKIRQGPLSITRALSLSNTSYRNIIIPNASFLPLRSEDGVGKVKSYVTCHDCDAPLVILERREPFNESKFISRAEALMWNAVCPFSPLANGTKLQLS